MSLRQQNSLLILRILVDLLSVCLAWILAYYVRFHTFIPVPKGIPDPNLYLKLLPFIWGIWLMVFTAAGLYKRTGQHRSAFFEGLDIIQNCFLASLGFIAFTYFYNEYRYSRVTLIAFAMIHPILIITGRSIVRKGLRAYKRNAPQRKVLAIGGGETLCHALDLPTAGEFEKGLISGVILVSSGEQRQKDEKICRQRNIPILELPANWPEFFSKSPVASVTFALPHSCYGFLDDHLEEIANQIPDIKMIPDLVRYTRFAAGIDLIDGTPVISINESPLAGWGSAIKRIIDIFGAVVALILFSPFMIASAILVPLTSRGPIFYHQDRMGLDGKTFRIYKFRSMPIDAESNSGAVWATGSDNRATWIGRLLRKSNIDETPQLFNVLRGDMSLVGPRPERPIFVDKFRRNVPGYMLRHKVKAGITGWAQINGWRGNTSIEKRIECDLFYIQNWSIWFDFRILLLTLLRSFIDKNAY